jgi:hypothetical protein
MGIKETILAANDRATAEVDVPEWGMKVTIRAFSASERDSLGLQMMKSKENIRAKTAALIIVDENGNRIFNDAEVEALGKKSAKALDRIFDAHLKLEQFTEEEAKEFEKNS